MTDKTIFAFLRDAWRNSSVSAEKTQDEVPVGHATSGLWNLTKGERRVLIPAVLLLLLSIGMTATLPLFPRYAIDFALKQNSYGFVYLLIGLFILTTLAGQIAYFIGDLVFMRFQQNIVLKLQRRAISKLLKLPTAFYQHKNSAYRISLLQSQLEQIEFAFSGVFIRTAASALLMTASIVIMFFMNWKLALMATILIPAVAYCSTKLIARLRNASENLWLRSAEAGSRAQEALRGISTIKSFTREKDEAEQQYRMTKEAITAKCAACVLVSLDSTFGKIVSRLAMAAVLGFGLTEIMSQRLSLGEFISFIGYMSYALNAIEIFPTIKSMLVPIFVASRKIFYLLDLVEEEQDEDSGLKVPRLNGEISMEHVTFSYDNREKVLHNVSFTVTPREKIAIVGKTGSGKSTLVLLLLGLYRPTSGKIIFDGQNLASLNLRSLRQRIGFVSQDVFLFNDTIYKNITYGVPEASDEQVKRSIAHSGLASFIDRLPDGLMTKVGEVGLEISGGERQRLALARTLLKSPDILILDEAMSAVDSDTEAAIKIALANEFGHTTTLIVSHRLSSIMSVNRVLVLESGRIAQQGSPNALLSCAGPFRDLFTDQVLE